MANTIHSNRRRHFSPLPAGMRGLTLIELMIAVVLGLGVMAGILSLYVNINESASYMNAAARVQENGRFAINHIVRTMRMAGYDDPATPTPAPTTIFLQGVSAGNVTMGVALDTSSDAVQMTFEGSRQDPPPTPAPPTVRDCTGASPLEDTWVTNTYAISTNGELVCNGLIIAEGVEAMRIRYGFDSNPDPDVLAISYYPAGSVPDWTTVVSVKIALRVNSVEEVFFSTLHSCESCGTEMFSTLPTANRLMRAEFHATVRLRNALGI